MAKKKKKDVFDYIVLAEKFKEDSKVKELWEHLPFRAQYEVFVRQIDRYIRMDDEAQSSKSTASAVGRSGETTIKANPLLKELTNLEKALVTTANSLQKMLDNVKVVEKDEEYFM